MAWILVHREVNYRRPNSKFSFNVRSAPVPQEWPQDVADYVVSKGAAERVPSPKREVKKALKGVKRAT